MTRPTKEHGPDEELMIDGGAGRAVILGREVSALREQLARVEALPAKWRAKAARTQSPLFTNAEHAMAAFTFRECADEVEAAKGEGS